MSSNKGLLGMAHSHARASDGIMYLEGCSVPVILREVGTPKSARPKTFSVVGGAYFRGLDGCDSYQEAAASGFWEEGDEALQEVVLC